MHKEHTTPNRISTSLKHIFVRINQDVSGLWPLGGLKNKRKNRRGQEFLKKSYMMRRHAQCEAKTMERMK